MYNFITFKNAILEQNILDQEYAYTDELILTNG